MTNPQSATSVPLQNLAELMLSVAGESVSLVKRTAPDRAMKLKRQEEWKIYLEFLKILFNLADRVSVLHVPIKDQPQFMDGLEDHITSQLKHVLQPAFESGSDQMEIVMTVCTAVAESRRIYEPYRFLVTEDSPAKNDMLKDFGRRIAELAGAPGNAQMAAAASLCVGAAIPAIQGILDGRALPDTSVGKPSQSCPNSTQPSMQGATGTDIKLISVMSTVTGEEIETRWGLHPRFRQDLTPDETQRLTKLMNRVAKILGERYAAVAFSDEWTSWHRAGHA